MNIATREEARNLLINCIEVGAANRDEYNIDAIIDEIGWTNILTIDDQAFWATIYRHEIEETTPLEERPMDMATYFKHHTGSIWRDEVIAEVDALIADAQRQELVHVSCPRDSFEPYSYIRGKRGRWTNDGYEPGWNGARITSLNYCDQDTAICHGPWNGQTICSTCRKPVLDF